VPTDLRAVSFAPIRRLGPADLRSCVALSADRGWSPEQAKWSLLLSASEVFGVDAPDGRGLAGAVVLTSWGAGLAAVGMMVVATRYGRRGLGRALMEHLLRAAGDGTTVTLFATDMGRPLYEKLGFAVVRRNVTFAGTFRPDPDNSKKRGARFSRARSAGRSARSAGPARLVRPSSPAEPAAVPVGPAEVIRAATEADLPAILAVDRAAFGADRGRILTRLPAFAQRIAVLENDRGVAGYAAAWRNHVTSTVIGPLVAPDGDAARRLIAALAAQVRTRVRLDLDPDRPELPAWANAHGLEPVDRTVVMAHGPLAPRGTPERLFTPISVALA
jgi:ribosomal protein S18 acetylase RimI-like enzyme